MPNFTQFETTHSSNKDGYERKEAKNGKNYQTIGKSQMYESAGGMGNGIKSVIANGKTKKIQDETT
jgi:uncharacterized protein YegP (UPF0339 family)